MNYADLMRALATIAVKPDASPRTMLITTRRMCRLLTAERARLDDEHRILRGKRAELEAYRPFTNRRIAALDVNIADLENLVETVELSLSSIGRVLVFDPNGIAKALGFDQLCALLGVNPTRRANACSYGTGIGDVVYAAELEDSETRRGRRWFEQPPLRAAIGRVASLYHQRLVRPQPALAKSYQADSAHAQRGDLTHFQSTVVPFHFDSAPVR